MVRSTPRCAANGSSNICSMIARSIPPAFPAAPTGRSPWLCDLPVSRSQVTGRRRRCGGLPALADGSGNRRGRRARSSSSRTRWRTLRKRHAPWHTCVACRPSR